MEEIIANALKGDISSLDSIVKQYYSRIFNLSLKFLWNPEDAEDITQEIFIKIFTHLSTFQNKSKFSTWIHRIAVNHLLNFKKRKEREVKITFNLIESELQKSNSIPYSGDDKDYLAGQVTTACTHAMYQALKKEHRIVFLLGEVFGTSSKEGAEILEITEVNFRKKLSRARSRMHNFLNKNCGLVNSLNSCRCSNRIQFSLQNEKLKPYLELSEKLSKEGKLKELESIQHKVEKFTNLALIYRATNVYESRKNILFELKEILSK